MVGDAGRVHRTKAAIQFFRDAEKREVAGLSTYGDFDPKKDKRILCVEAIEECLDCANYMDFLYRKHPILKPKAREVQMYAFKTWCLLNELEAQEAALNERKGG